MVEIVQLCAKFNNWQIKKKSDLSYTTDVNKNMAYAITKRRSVMPVPCLKLDKQHPNFGCT